eukprot:CAMPEP_0119005134 /NCGR_PEP_ID=MMETSP1176-20130426/1545_1 /TAXON_ID=265551 /ORGANISM="Synedropsis recta cf, Strain CCMP1620" /LENGTH=932 /DNA_ID=CAMNT_0006956907 /DNA_START=89 /DNA_END=2887 /DNA_ORIENTATION=+
MVSSVLIGKDRRVTLEEIQSVALYDALLELHAPGIEDLPVVATTDELSTALAGLTVTDDDDDLLSGPATTAALTLLALNVSQGRIIKPATSSCCLKLTSGLIDIVNASKAATTTTTLRLSSDATKFHASLCTLLSTADAEVATALQSLPLFLVARTLFLAAGAVACTSAVALSQLSVAVSALSVESCSPTKARWSDYAEVRYDNHRPHRGLITVAASLRAILNTSQFVTVGATVADATAPPPPAAISNIPQYTGPAQESLQAVSKTMELEVNCFEGNTTDVLDDTVATLALNQAQAAVQTLLTNAMARFSGITTATTTASTSLTDAVNQLQTVLQDEAKAGVTFVTEQNNKAAEDAKQKEAEKAARTAGAGASTKAPSSSQGDEFAGMTEAQKKKVLKKRADKEAKAAAKAAAKQSRSVSLFGTGTQSICTILQGANFDLLADKTTLLQIEQCLDKLLSGGVQRKPKIAKGTRDYLPDQMMIRQQAFSIIRRVFESHGAVEIDTPVFELKDTLTGKYGEDSKLIYDLANQGGEILALRYDLTVPFARFLALNSVGNIKRFHIGKVYRRDRPVLSKGRYREFYQCDFDIAGTYGRMVPDSECLCVACDILDALPIGDFAIKLNHRRLLDAILDICGVPADKFRTICSAVDKLDKEPWEEVKREMVEDKGLKPDVADQIGTFVLQKGAPWDMYKTLMDGKKFGTHKGALEAMEDLRILFEYLDAMGKLQFMSFDLSLARGLDYYTGVIYEAICLSGTAQVGSIGGGGRYDNLVSMFQEAGKITPCVGVSVGIERVFTLMEQKLAEEKGSIKQPNVKILVASAGDNMLPEKMRVTRLLWDSNLSAEFSQQENPKLKYEITNALDRKIPFMVVVGENELKENKVQVKDLAARTEELVLLDDLVKTLRSKGVVPVGCDFAADLFAKEDAAAAEVQES